MHLSYIIKSFLQATETVPTPLQSLPVLVVLDHIDQMPWFSDFSTSLMDLLRRPHTHVVAISKTYAPSDALLREIDHKLLRGCKVIDVKPLSMMHTTQRIVHAILSAHHFVPNDEDQKILEKLAQFTSGSPALIDVIAALFLSEMKHDSQNASQDTHDTLVNCTETALVYESGHGLPCVIGGIGTPRVLVRRSDQVNVVIDILGHFSFLLLMVALPSFLLISFLFFLKSSFSAFNLSFLSRFSASVSFI